MGRGRGREEGKVMKGRKWNGREGGRERRDIRGEKREEISRNGCGGSHSA
jgi:hypothetical protein